MLTVVLGEQQKKWESGVAGDGIDWDDFLGRCVTAARRGIFRRSWGSAGGQSSWPTVREQLCSGTREMKPHQKDDAGRQAR